LTVSVPVSNNYFPVGTKAVGLRSKRPALQGGVQAWVYTDFGGRLNGLGS